MVRIGRALEIVEVARHASRAREVVVIVGMAIGALARRHGVRSGQRESGGRVIELAAGPRDHVVTLLASCRKTGVRDRSSRGIEVVLVATDARRTRDVVVVVDVTVGTLPRGHHVRTCQRESRLRVVKGRLLPG